MTSQRTFIKVVLDFRSELKKTPPMLGTQGSIASTWELPKGAKQKLPIEIQHNGIL